MESALDTSDISTNMGQVQDAIKAFFSKWRNSVSQQAKPGDDTIRLYFQEIAANAMQMAKCVEHLMALNRKTNEQLKKLAQRMIERYPELKSDEVVNWVLGLPLSK